MSQELKDKLFHFKATPAERSWNAIAEALDHQAPAYVQRLDQYAETPGKHNWEIIANNLAKGDKPARVLSSARFRFPVKMMIAVALLAVVAFGIIQTINSGFFTGKKEGGTAKHLPAAAGSTALQDSRKTATNNSGNEDITQEPTNSEGSVNKAAEDPKEVKLRPSRYVTINNDEGKRVRLSKKAYTLMACAENSTAENYNSCKETIQMMQEKMSGALISPSGDFSGLVDMVRSIEEIN